MTSTPTKPVDNVVIATKGLQDRNTNISAGTTVENKGKLILYHIRGKKIRNTDITKNRNKNASYWFSFQFRMKKQANCSFENPSFGKC